MQYAKCTQCALFGGLMTTKRKHLGEKLSVLAKSTGLSQTALADRVGVPPSQVNRYFRGHNDVHGSILLDLLKELGIDIDELVSRRVKSLTDVEKMDPDCRNEALVFLFNELDELGRQTYLSQLLWAAKISKGDAFPKKVEEQIKREISLI
jgi:transcriptional regulator with XRE-family HTH domain